MDQAEREVLRRVIRLLEKVDLRGKDSNFVKAQWTLRDLLAGIIRCEKCGGAEAIDFGATVVSAECNCEE